MGHIPKAQKNYNKSKPLLTAIFLLSAFNISHSDFRIQISPSPAFPGKAL
jgi:hypothetical protein